MTVIKWPVFTSFYSDKPSKQTKNHTNFSVILSRGDMTHFQFISGRINWHQLKFARLI